MGMCLVQVFCCQTYSWSLALAPLSTPKVIKSKAGTGLRQGYSVWGHQLPKNPLLQCECSPS